MADATSYEPGGSGGGVPSTRSINAGTGLSGGGTLASDRTISLATLSPSPAGTYTSPAEVVVNSRGQVTSVTSGTGGGAVVLVSGCLQFGSYGGSFSLCPGQGTYPPWSGTTKVAILTAEAGLIPKKLLLSGYLNNGRSTFDVVVRKNGVICWSGSSDWVDVGTVNFTNPGKFSRNLDLTGLIAEGDFVCVDLLITSFEGGLTWAVTT